MTKEIKYPAFKIKAQFSDNVCQYLLFRYKKADDIEAQFIGSYKDQRSAEMGMKDWIRQRARATVKPAWYDDEGRRQFGVSEEA